LSFGQGRESFFGAPLGFDQLFKALLGLGAKTGQLLRQSQKFIGEHKSAEFCSPLRSLFQKPDKILKFFYCKRHRAFLSPVIPKKPDYSPFTVSSTKPLPG